MIDDQYSEFEIARIVVIREELNAVVPALREIAHQVFFDTDRAGSCRLVRLAP